VGARHGFGRPWALAGAVSWVGCFPQADPPWLEVEPKLLALRIEVDEPGPLSALVFPVPLDRRRVEAMPGDSIRFEPWVLAPQRVLGGEDIDAAYFACGSDGDCFTAFEGPDVMTPCDPTVSLAGACAIGRGPDARYTIPTPSPESLDGFVLPAQLLVVAGEPGVRSTDDCIAELRQRPYHDLSACMLLSRSIPLGPSWLFAALLGADPEEIPPEVLLQWPNFNPEVGRIEVSIDNREQDARTGDRLAVRIGQRVRLTVVPDPRDEQQYAELEATGQLTYQHEGLSTDWYANGQIDTTTEYWQKAPVLSWSSRVEGVVRFDVLLSDGVGGLGWGSLTFEISE
jgi:hypothetical protein